MNPLKIFFSVISLYLTVSIFAQSSYLKPPYTNGEVKTIVSYGDTVIVGGRFTEAISYESSAQSFTIYDTLTNSVLPIKLDLKGKKINKIIPDENNSGFYVGGDFTSIGDSIRYGVAHLDSLGRVTAKFNRIQAGTMFVNDLLLHGDTLLMGGQMANICGNGCFGGNPLRLREINTLNGITNSSTLPFIDGRIDNMVIDALGARYICGNFSQVGNVKRNGLAKIDSNGNVLPWYPITSGLVRTLFLNGNFIILGGGFDMANGQLKNSIVEVDTSLGLTNTTLDIKAKYWGRAPQIYGFAKWINSLIIVGEFDTVGDSARSRVAIIDLSTNRATAQIINTNGFVKKAIVSGNQLYIGGTFTTVNGLSRNCISSINLSNNSIGTLSINLTSLLLFNFQVYDMALVGSALYVAGISSPNTTVTQIPGILNYNTITATLTNQFSIDLNKWVTNLLVSKGVLYASGNFTKINGLDRLGLVAINPSSNSILPNSNNLGFQLIELLAVQGDRLLVYSSVNPNNFLIFNNNQYQTSLIGLHTSSDSVFTFSHQIFGNINTFLKVKDTLFIGGEFSLFGRNLGSDSLRRYFAAIQLSTFNLFRTKIWTPSNIVQSINCIVQWQDNLIMGGAIQSSGLLSYNLKDSTTLVYSRPYTGQVNSMVLLGQVLYLAGDFNFSGNSVGLMYTGAHSIFGATNTWANNFTSAKSIILAGNKLSVVGDVNIGGVAGKELNNFRIPVSGIPSLISSQLIQSVQGAIFAILSNKSKLILGGDFLYLGGKKTARNLLAYQRSNGKIVMGNLQTNAGSSEITHLAIFQNTLFIGGRFDSINTILRKNIAAINLITGTINSWNPNVSTSYGYGVGIHLADSLLLVHGIFDTIASQPRSSVAAFNLPSGSLNSWNPNFNSGAFIYQVESNRNTLFFSGAFSSVNGIPASKLVSFNKANLTYNSSWNPVSQNSVLANKSIYNIKALNNHLYILLSNSTVLKLNITTGINHPQWSISSFPSHTRLITPYSNGLIIAHFFVDTVQGNKTPITELTNLPVNAINIQNNTLLAGGLFKLNTYPKPIRENLYEFTLDNIETLRLEIPTNYMCIGKPYTLKIFSTDTATKRDFLIQFQGYTMGIVNIPNKPECTFIVPNLFSPGEGYSLSATSINGVLQPYSTFNLGNTPSKALLLSQSPALCSGQNLQIFYADSSNRLINKYQWFKNDTIITGATQYQLNMITQLGNYKGRVESNIGCADTTNIVSVTNTGLCASPTQSASQLTFRNILTTSVTLFWKNGNGTSRIVLAKLDSAVNTSPNYGVTYNALSQFGLGDSIGFKNYTIYNGANNQCTLQGLIPGRRYHFAVIEYNETGAATAYQSSSYLIGNIIMPATTYHNKSTGNLNVLSTWGSNTDGTGSTPSSFAIPAVYIVRNGTTPTINGNWSLDNKAGVVSIGLGSSSPPLQLTIPNGITVTCGNINLNGNAILTTTGNLTTNFLNASDTSLVVYNGVSTQQLSPSSIGKFAAQLGNKIMNGDFWVKDTLRLDANILANNTVFEDTFTLGTRFFPRGSIIRTSGSIAAPFKRWIINAVASGTSGLLPLGPNNQSFQVNITTPASDIGSILISSHFITSPAGNNGLPLSENSVNINTVGTNGYWKVINAENRQGLSYNLIATANNFFGVTQPLQTRLVNRSIGGNWRLFGSFPIIAGNTSSFTLTKNNVSTFGEFAVAGNLAVNPLPVVWLSINANWQNENVILKWQTAIEQNNQKFEVERSSDNKYFSKIGEITGKGTTSNVSNYMYTDQHINELFTPKKVLYYRLKQIDFDGKYNFSKTVNVNITEKQNSQVFIIYPNPSYDYIYLVGLNTQAVIYDVLGNEVLVVKEDGVIDISAFKQGIYFVKCNAHIQKFVKQ